MFGLGMWEIAVIAIVALLFVGPDKLPDAAKKISRGIRDLRQQTKDLSQTLDKDTEFGSAVRDLKSALRGDDIPSRPYVPPHLRKPDPDVSSLIKGDGDGADGDEPAHSVSTEPAAIAAVDDDADSGMPVIRPPADSVAKSDGPEPPPDDPARGDGDGSDVGKAHG